MSGQVAYAIARGLHDVFAAVWVGGLVTMSLVVLPAMRSLQQPAPAGGSGGEARSGINGGGTGVGGRPVAILGALQRRLRAVASVAILGVVLTGIVLVRSVIGPAGGIDPGTTYGALFVVKLMLVAAMIALAVARSAVQRGIERAAAGERGTTGAPEAGAAAPGGRVRLSAVLLLANTALGVAVLILSGVGSAIGV